VHGLANKVVILGGGITESCSSKHSHKLMGRKAES
jgi:hypothetical protein